MPEQVFKKIRKRSGRLHKFNPAKIERAIASAGQVTSEFDDKVAKKLTIKVLRLAHQLTSDEEHSIPTVEDIQDIVEEILLGSPYNKTAKEYIIFREKKSRIKEISASFNRDLINQYLKKSDWQVNENSNMGFSLQGLNNYMSSELSKVYWLNEIYPKEIGDAHTKGDFHIHDLSALSVYCVGWDLWDLLVEGFTGVPEKTESKPAKHLRTALGQIVNFFYTLQGEAAGAQAFSNLDTLLAPFIRYDKLTYKEVKQSMQEFIFNVNVPTRVGFQCMSEDTEILTADGWKFHDGVNAGDTIATFNLEKEAVEYLPVKKMFSREYKGKMYNLKNRISDQLISPKHRVVRRKFGGYGYVLEEIETVKDMKSPFMVPIGSRGAISSAGEVTDQSDDSIRLFAWVVSEGTYDKGQRGAGRISIYQSKIANPDKYNEIKNICSNLGLKYTERIQFGLGRPCNVLRFDADSTREILGYFDDDNIKEIPECIRHHLDAEGAKIFLETYIKGDGHEGNKITTTSRKICDDIQEVAVVAGYGSTVIVRKPEGISKKDRYIIRIIKHQDTYINCVEEIDYEGVIWCPNTDNETVIARRNGKVFITGNTPFTNVTLDLTPSPLFKDQNVIIGGKPQKEKYGDFQKEMDWFNKAFFEVMLEGDASGRVFTFPIPTYNITRDFDWDNPNLSLLWDITARYGIPYFSNFINSDMNPEDARSMCPMTPDTEVLVRGEQNGIRISNIDDIVANMDRGTSYEVWTPEGWSQAKPVKVPKTDVYEITLSNGCIVKFGENHLQPIMGKDISIKARYGIPYFSNFINSDMNPEDARSMCCRLRLNTKELATRGGGLFGANPLTGSIGVVTINMPRLAHTSETGVDFMKNLGKLMDQAKESLEIKRKVLEEFADNDLYPYAKFYLRSVKKRFHKYWFNHFSTIGLVGMNEACLNLLGEDISTKRGHKFASKVLDYMRDRLVRYQKETGNNYNLEATPAEGTAYRLAIKDKLTDKSIICANEEAYKEGADPFYSNSTQLPVGHTDNIFDALDLQDNLQVKYTGGTVMHLFIGEKIDDPVALKKLVRVICENYHLPYFTITPTFSICPKHGYLFGEHHFCPKCDAEIEKELEKK